MTKRRTLLKTCSIGAASIVSGTTVGAAKSSNRYWGLVYDPLTHEVLGECSGQFSEVNGNLKGRFILEFEDGRDGISYTINYSKPDEIVKQNNVVNRSYTRYQEGESGRKTPSERVRILTSGRTVSGTIRTPSRDTVAFTLMHEDATFKLDAELSPKEVHEEGINEDGLSSTNDGDISTSSSDGDYRKFSYGARYVNDYEVDDEFDWIAYLTGVDTNDNYNYDQLPNGTFTRWNLQSYFMKAPDPNVEVDNLYLYDPTFYISCVPGLGYPRDGSEEDPEIRLDSERPTASDNPSSFSIGISYPFSVVSAGPSVSVDLSTSRTDFEYDHSYSEWLLDRSTFPEDQEENSGVYLDVFTNTSQDEKEFEWEVEWHWSYDLPDDGRDPNIVHEYETITRTPTLGVTDV